MRKLFSIAMVIALLFMTSMAGASVGYKKDGVPQGNAASIDFQEGHTTFDGSTVTFYANGYKDGVTTNVSTESNLDSAALAYGVVKLQGHTSAKYVSLAAGTAGQIITFIMTQDNGATVYITDDSVSVANQAAVVETGWDDIAFDDVNDMVTLLYVDSTYGWIVIGQYGVTIT